MKKLLIVASLFAPAIAMAQQPITDANSLATKLINLGNLFTYLLVALAVIFIIFNVVWYLIKGGDTEARGKAGMNILWGIVGLFIIISIWGLVNILVGTFRTTPTNTRIPQVQNINNGNIPLVP